ncbi:hydroxyphenylacetyl-CoA thioesterase PaaI [Gymnodinialimonas ceratoperidinii]|uniref:Hydroxyphenylacetyl-CoA thioesterase PaaI n=1 Tax=Gymnodinialimonas ceratoperidinii TaxID=2856823 RepID=A0A8F6YCV8_9RHOB|nr:hydroxyphenylacetyl-CoA thioesterase PaaI [Gymnodinialimonas ceratoperidinii]QXT39592.1 hydroxyphenylacetyl-CoA thioesterase PaaI [Gymnodinialimonas ceratoperidinii]
MTPKQRATRSAEAMWAGDKASAWVGMEIAEIDEGRATLTLDIREDHCNGHGIGHGGVTFMLADSAFAFACNSRNVTTVAQHNSISFLAPVRLGDTLTATAVEQTLRGRSGITDVTVTNQSGETIALFRGASRALGSPLFEE